MHKQINHPQQAIVSLSAEEQVRYSRHLQLDGFGLTGQLRLKKARVLIVGAGGLGCPAGLYLAGAGVGSVAVVDDDIVDLSNIHRQVAFKTAQIGQLKADVLVDTMRGINPDLHYQVHNLRIAEENVASLVNGYDLVIDGTDNFSTRFLIADACYFSGVPLLHGAVHQYSAQIALFTFGDLPCFRCLYPYPPVSGALAACNEVGILGPVTGVVGTMIAVEAVKYLAGIHCVDSTLKDTESKCSVAACGVVLPLAASHEAISIMKYDALNQTIEHISLSKDPDCPLCGENPTIRTGENNSVQAKDLGVISVQEARQFITQGAILIDVREPFEYARGHIENAMLMPILELKEKLAASKIAKNAHLVVYCQHGVRSLAAVTFLREAGYKNSYTIDGGMECW